MAEFVGLLAAALALGLFARRLKQKAIIGYLLAGLLAGPKGLGIVQSQGTVQFLADLGVALLLFSIGLEFSWQRIGALGRGAAWAGLLQCILTWASAAGAAWAMGLSPAGCFAFGNIIALSSTAFVLRILQDRTELESRHGRLVVGILLLQDLLLIPLLILQSVVAEGNSGWEGIVDLAQHLGRGALLVAIFYVVVRLVVQRVFRGADTYAERDVPVILSVLVCMGCAWACHVAGLSPVLGAFLAGMLLADQPVADQVRANVMPLRAIFVTIFFASIGMYAGLPSASQVPVLLLVAASIIAGKSLLAALSIRLGGAPWRVAALGGLALAQIGEFSFVLANDGLQRGLLPEGWFEPVVSSAVVTLLAAPYIFEIGGRLAGRVFRAGLPEKAPSGQSAGRHETGADVIIVGYGPAGREVARDMMAAGQTVAIIESNPGLVKAADGPRMFVGDGTDAETLLRAGLRLARALVLTIPDPGVSRTVLGIIRTLAPDLPVLVRARYHRYAGPILRLGADSVADEELLVGQALARTARRRLDLPPSD